MNSIDTLGGDRPNEQTVQFMKSITRPDPNLLDMAPTPIPEWLTAGDPKLPKPSPEAKLLIQTQFEIMFETVLDKLAKGVTLAEILRTDLRQPEYANFINWVIRDPKRKGRYYEAQEVGAEVLSSEAVEIADGVNTIEDVQRSKLRVDTRKWLVGVYNKRRFGEVKQIEIAGTISIADALQQAQMRVIQGEVIESLEDNQPRSGMLSSNSQSVNPIDEDEY